MKFHFTELNSTYSIVARDAQTGDRTRGGQFDGVAVQSGLIR